MQIRTQGWEWAACLPKQALLSWKEAQFFFFFCNAQVPSRAQHSTRKREGKQSRAQRDRGRAGNPRLVCSCSIYKANYAFNVPRSAHAFSKPPAHDNAADVISPAPYRGVVCSFTHPHPECMRRDSHAASSRRDTGEYLTAEEPPTKTTDIKSTAGDCAGWRQLFSSPSHAETLRPLPSISPSGDAILGQLIFTRKKQVSCRTEGIFSCSSPHSGETWEIQITSICKLTYCMNGSPISRKSVGNRGRCQSAP